MRSQVNTVIPVLLLRKGAENTFRLTHLPYSTILFALHYLFLKNKIFISLQIADTCAAFKTRGDSESNTDGAFTDLCLFADSFADPKCMAPPRTKLGNVQR